MANFVKTDFLTNLTVLFEGVPKELVTSFTVTEVSMTESLLTPGLQTTVQVQSQMNVGYLKNLDQFYNKNVHIIAERPVIEKMGLGVSKLETTQRIARLSKRDRINYQVETFNLELVDPSLIMDAMTYVSQSWKCSSPSQITADVLTDCIGAQSLDIEQNLGPRHSYISENIHPFQVLTQQEEIALAGYDSDPSLVHFMTYQNRNHENVPTHNFRSITKMAQEPPSFSFVYSGKNSVDLNYAGPSDIMKYSFPCDFDVISDALNGIDPSSGSPANLINTINLMIDQHSIYGKAEDGCGTTPWTAVSALGTEEQQDTCAYSVEKWAPLRKARMAMLDQDRVALRMVVPFNPNLNVGRVINVKFYQSLMPDTPMYGSGDYLISAMTHNIKYGGMGVTTIDCVAETVAAGII